MIRIRKHNNPPRRIGPLTKLPPTAGLLVCLTMFGCQNFHPNEYSMRVYRPGFGVGPNPNLYPALRDGHETEQIHDAIVLALQKRDAALIDQTPLNGEVNSDTVLLSRGAIDAYNLNVESQSKPQFTVPNDRQYGLAFKVQYELKDSELGLKISAFLKNRGAGNPAWQALSPGHDYESLYFTNPLYADIQSSLQSMTQPAGTQP